MLDDASTAYITVILNGDHAETDRLGRALDTADQLDHQHQHHPVLLDAALDYAGRGIAVFPLKPRGKQPVGGHGFKDATTNPDQIRGWWTGTPDANIGVPTGLTFDVVDIDGTPGIASMYNGPHALADSLTILGVATTSRDGGRHLYVPASGRGNKTSIYPGVDYRGAGGYVVAPPSIGANGQPYHWVQHLTAEVAAA